MIEEQKTSILKLERKIDVLQTRLVNIESYKQKYIDLFRLVMNQFGK